MNASAEKQINSVMTLQQLYQKAGSQELVPNIDGIYLDPQIEPMPHQLGDLNNAMRYQRWGFFSDTGCGKTFPAQAFAIYCAAYGEKVLTVMPPALLYQYQTSMYKTFVGLDGKYKSHILNEPPYPLRMTKKRVQEVQRALHKNEDPGVPRLLAEYIRGFAKSEPIEFTQRDVDRIRRSGNTPEAIAAEYGCTVSTVKRLRSKKEVFREDLFAEWDRTGTWPEFLLMSYQMFLRCSNQIQHAYGCLIADEVHMNLQHPSSKTWQKTRGFLLNKGREHVAFVPMTGTPIQNVPTDAYAVVKLLNPRSYDNYESFKNMHVDEFTKVDDEGRRRTIIMGYKNLDVLRTHMFARASRVTKEEVLSLEKPQIIERDVVLGKEHLELYRKLVRERVLEVDGQQISAVQAQSLRQKVLQISTVPDPFTDRPIKDNAFKEAVTELLDEIGCKQHEKVVIFAIYNKTIETMAKWFSDLNPALVYGKSDTQKNVDKFLNDASCRLMIAHYQSGGVGLNLQDVCRYVICAEPTSVPGQFKQATDRVYRKGQTKVVSFYILRILRTGWVKQVESMKGKLKLSSQVVMDKADMLKELLDE